MAVFKRGGVWWYKFYFAGQFIRESTKSTSKTVAKDAETQRRRELEQGYHNLRQRRESRIRLLRDVADEYLADYKPRFRGITFAEYAIGHVVRHLGDKLLVDIDEAEVLGYQSTRLKESAAPKSINEEVRFLLTMMGESGDVIRVRLRKKKKLKLPSRRKIGKAYEPEETQHMRQLSRNSRSPHIHLALTMALNAGMRDAEIKSLAWNQIHLDKKFIQVGESETAAGEGRTIPINSVLQKAIVEHMAWYRKKFNEIRPEWFVFPFGRPRPWDPTRHVTTIKTAWRTIRTNARVTGRWHDHRHTLITQLAEGGAGEETIRQIVGHVSKEVLEFRPAGISRTPTSTPMFGFQLYSIAGASPYASLIPESITTGIIPFPVSESYPVTCVFRVLRYVASSASAQLRVMLYSQAASTKSELPGFACSLNPAAVPYTLTPWTGTLLEIASVTLAAFAQSGGSASKNTSDSKTPDSSYMHLRPCRQPDGSQADRISPVDCNAQLFFIRFIRANFARLHLQLFVSGPKFLLHIFIFSV